VSPDFDERDRRSVLHDLASADAEARRLAVERVGALPADEAVAALVERLADPSWRVRKAAVARLVAMSEVPGSIERLIEALGDGENPGRRNSAVEALVQCGAPAVPQLVRAIGSHDADVRKLVIDALAGIAAPQAEAALVAALGDRDANVRAAAADALGTCSGAGVERALRELAARAGEDRLVRLSALRALAALDASVPAAELSPLLGDRILCPAAIDLLGHSEDAAAPELIKWLASGSRTSRMAAVRALLRLLARSDGLEAERLADEVRAAAAGLPVVDDAIAALAEGDLATQLGSAHFLGIVRDPRAVVPLLGTARDEALAEVSLATLEELGPPAEALLDEAWPRLDAQARRTACRLFSRTRTDAGAGRLLAALEDSAPEVRIEAARGVARRRLSAALASLLARLESLAHPEEAEAEEEWAALTEALVALASASGADPGSGTTRAEAATAGDPCAARPALDLLAARIPGAGDGVRLAIATVLGRVGRSGDTPTATLLLKDPSPRVRRAAVEALARLDPGTAAEPLRLALADEAAEVRIAAASALGASANDAVVDDLERLADDPDPRVRAAAVRAVGRRLAGCCDPALRARGLGRLHAALDEGGLAALAAVEALREIGGPAARAVGAVLERPEPELVKEAVATLAAHGDPGDLVSIVPLVGHPHWSVRAEAISTLSERRCASAVPAILRRLEVEQDEFVRAEILRALERLEA
jgi:HEAT repeat protein